MSDDTKTEDLFPETLSNVKSFAAKKNKMTTPSLMDEGLETFARELAGAKGFLAIIFDEDNNPIVLCSGEIDIVSTVGALEVAKNELFKNIFSEVD